MVCVTALWHKLSSITCSRKPEEPILLPIKFDVIIEHHYMIIILTTIVFEHLKFLFNFFHTVHIDRLKLPKFLVEIDNFNHLHTDSHVKCLLPV